jgi:hypothetical protein
MATSTPQRAQPGPRLLDGSDLNKWLAQPAMSIESATVATGTTRADAYQLRAAVTVFGTVAASTGAKLDSTLPPGAVQTVYNDGASPLTVYAADAIDGTAGATGVALANAKRAAFTRLPSGAWISAQLGAVSA